MKFRSENVRELLAGLKAVGLNPLWNNQCSLPDLIRLPLRIESAGKRDTILKASERMGLGIARTYPDSVDCIVDINAGFERHYFPVAKEYAEQLACGKMIILQSWGYCIDFVSWGRTMEEELRFNQQFERDYYNNKNKKRDDTLSGMYLGHVYSKYWAFYVAFSVIAKQLPARACSLAGEQA